MVFPVKQSEIDNLIISLGAAKPNNNILRQIQNTLYLSIYHGDIITIKTILDNLDHKLFNNFICEFVAVKSANRDIINILIGYNFTFTNSIELKRLETLLKQNKELGEVEKYFSKIYSNMKKINFEIKELTIIESLVLDENHEQISLYLEHKALKEDTDLNDDLFSIYYAYKLNNITIVDLIFQYYTKNYSGKINVGDKDKLSKLIYLISQNSNHEYLIKLLSNIDQDIIYQTAYQALNFALKSNNEDVVKIILGKCSSLLNYYSEVNNQNELGKAILSIFDRILVYHSNDLADFAFQLHPEIDPYNNNLLVLYLAYNYNKKNIAKLIIDNHYVINLSVYKGFPITYYALKAKDNEMIEWLCNKGLSFTNEKSKKLILHYAIDFNVDLRLIEKIYDLTLLKFKNKNKSAKNYTDSLVNICIENNNELILKKIINEPLFEFKAKDYLVEKLYNVVHKKNNEVISLILEVLYEKSTEEIYHHYLVKIMQESISTCNDELFEKTFNYLNEKKYNFNSPYNHSEIQLFYPCIMKGLVSNNIKIVGKFLDKFSSQGNHIASLNIVRKLYKHKDVVFNKALLENGDYSIIKFFNDNGVNIINFKPKGKTLGHELTKEINPDNYHNVSKVIKWYLEYAAKGVDILGLQGSSSVLRSLIQNPNMDKNIKLIIFEKYFNKIKSYDDKFNAKLMKYKKLFTKEFALDRLYPTIIEAGEKIIIEAAERNKLNNNSYPSLITIDKYLSIVVAEYLNFYDRVNVSMLLKSKAPLDITQDNSSITIAINNSNTTLTNEDLAESERSDSSPQVEHLLLTDRVAQPCGSPVSQSDLALLTDRVAQPCSSPASQGDLVLLTDRVVQPCGSPVSQSDLALLTDRVVQPCGSPVSQGDLVLLTDRVVQPCGSPAAQGDLVLLTDRVVQPYGSPAAQSELSTLSPFSLIDNDDFTLFTIIGSLTNLFETLP